MRFFARYQISVLILLIGLIGGCSTLGENPDTTFFLAKEWKINEILLQDPIFIEYAFSCEEGINGSEENYRIRVNDDNTFEEVDFCGLDQSGTWDLLFDDQVLRLIYLEKSNDLNPDTLQYIIESIQIREVILKLIPDQSKTGDSGIRFVLEPVKS